MRRVTLCLLWFYVFTISWDTVEFPLVGSVSRLAGLAVFVAALATTTADGGFRKPGAVVGFAVAFAIWCAMSLAWTISYDDTYTRAGTYLQLLVSVWVFREFIRTRENVQTMLAAFCIGSFVPLIDILNNFRTGAELGSKGSSRYTGSDVNADIIGLSLAIGLPMAWYLMMHCRGRIIRLAALIYFVLAPLALLLTGTRGAFLAALVAVAAIPLTMPRQSSLRFKVLVGLLLTVAGMAVALLVPQATWDRIFTIHTEISEGKDMNGRTQIWNAGLQVFPEHPVLGVGAGAYGAAAAPYWRSPKRIFPHNLPLGLLVENGIIGLGLYTAMLGACAWTIARLSSGFRALWGVLMLTWLVGALSSNWEYSKISWMLFGLVAAQSGLATTVGDVSPVEHENAAAGCRTFPAPGALVADASARSLT
jgi:O-antigen ligase